MLACYTFTASSWEQSIPSATELKLTGLIPTVDYSDELALLQRSPSGTSMAKRTIAACNPCETSSFSCECSHTNQFAGKVPHICNPLSPMKEMSYVERCEVPVQTVDGLTTKRSLYIQIDHYSPDIETHSS